MVIRVLDEKTINKIAAGEVIENPASVVKELCENSIDASAARISIEIVGGGLQKIVIRDDGLGMSRDDAYLCFERHATSKLKEAEDLHQILSMGFRGEALATIAAIGKCSLTTSEGDGGVQIYIEGSRLLRNEPCPRKRGTTIEVSSLFFNTPARKKFQKSPQSCQADITKMLTKIAIAYPEISFRLEANGGEIFDLPVQSFKERVTNLLGEGYTNGMVEIPEGLIGPPEKSRSNRTGQYLFINRRCVNVPLIGMAIGDVYSTRLAPREFPTFVLRLELPTEWVDVNVHPQKKEVRLTNEREILDPLKESLRKALHVKPVFFEPMPFVPTTVEVNYDRFFEEPVRMETPKLPVQELDVIGLLSPHLFCTAASLACWFDLSDESGFVMINLNRVRQRLLYDQIYARLLKEERGQMQSLMFPLTFSCTKGEAELLSENLAKVAALGIEIKPIGVDTFSIESLSSHIEEDQTDTILQDCIELFERKGDSLDKSIHKLALLGSKSYKRSRFLLDEASRLIVELAKSKEPFTSPKSEAVMAHIDEAYLEQLFTQNRTNPRCNGVRGA